MARNCRVGPAPITTPAQFELRDYFVEFKIPLVWVSHPKDAERSPAASAAEEEKFAREVFQGLPPNIPCLGWWDHGLGGEEGCGENGPYSGVDLASQYAKFEICSALDGYGRGVGNLSVHSGTSATFRQKTIAPPPLANKVYYAFTRTDGDGPNFWRQVYRDLWDQPDHGKVPVGWQLGPTAYDLIPDILDYFYKHATPNDVFVNALTGIGYIREADYAEMFPTSEQEVVWNQYLDLSRRYFKLLGSLALDHLRGFQANAAADLGAIHAVAGHQGHLRQLQPRREHHGGERHERDQRRAGLPCGHGGRRSARHAGKTRTHGCGRCPRHPAIHPRQASGVSARVADELDDRHARAGGNRKDARAGLRRGACRPTPGPLPEAKSSAQRH